VSCSIKVFLDIQEYCKHRSIVVKI